MTGPDDAIPVIPSTDSREPELERAIRRGSVLGSAAASVRRRCVAVRNRVVAAAPVLLVLAAAFGGWWVYAEWRMGRIELTTEGEPVVVQVLAEESETTIGEQFDLASRAVLTLPDGEYRLRVNGKGRVGRTYRFAVNPWETQSHAISIDEARLLGGERAAASEWKTGERDLVSRLAEILGRGKPKLDKAHGPIAFAPGTAALELTAGKADLIEWTAGSFICRDGATGAVIWDALHPSLAFAGGHDPTPFLAKHFLREAAQHSLVEPAPDLDGDGTGDLLLNLRSDAVFVALSGDNGSLLWNHVAEVDGPAESTPSELDWMTRSMRYNATAGEPAMADVDRDGMPDLIATFLLSASSPDGYRRIVVGISGRTGKSLWTYRVDKSPITLSRTREERPAVLVQGRESALVAYVDGAEWIGLDPATGKLRVGPIDLGLDPVSPVQHADLDGDGEPEILAVGPGSAAGQRTLRVFSTKTGRGIWVATIDAAYDQLDVAGFAGASGLVRATVGAKGVPSRDRPTITDLDDDGRWEIIVPDAGPMPPLVGYRGVRVIEGLSGATRWTARLGRAATTFPGGLAEVVVAPDLDGDGVREVITVSVIAEGDAPGIYVDATSGKGGRRLWWWKSDLPKELTQIRKPAWWGRGPDGWPLLALPLGGEVVGDIAALLDKGRSVVPIIHVLEASTGRKRHTVVGVTTAGFADLDGDGLVDLWGDVDGELRAFRGEAPEAWRALGRFDRTGSSSSRTGIDGNRGADFDGDGVADTLKADDESVVDGADSLTGNLRAGIARLRGTAGIRTAVARSGRDGHAIWKRPLDAWQSWFDPNGDHTYSVSAFPLPAGDFDGDGIPDVVATGRVQSWASPKKQQATMPIELLSGRTGARVWSAGRLPVRSGVRGYADVEWAEACAVEANGSSDLIVSHIVGSGSNLARVSGRDGRVIWDAPLLQNSVSRFLREKSVRLFEDLDGDGGLDVAVVVPSLSRSSSVTTSLTLAAVSLRDGKRLWSQVLEYNVASGVEIQVGDVDGDRRPDVVAVEEVSESSGRTPRIRVFDGRSGRVCWSYTPADEVFPLLSSHLVILANFEGNGTRNVCVSSRAKGARRIVVLDSKGKEQAHRDVVDDGRPNLNAGDLDGDGRDELLLAYGGLVHAWDRDLKERWCWPSRFGAVDQIVPAAPGRPREAILAPGIGLDATTGQARWTGQTPLVESSPQLMSRLLDAGGPKRLPLLIGNGAGTTVCRAAMPSTGDGSIAAAEGNLVQVGRTREDPRWARPLPWFRRLRGPVGPRSFFAAAGLALVNLGLPLSILRLAARKRRQFNIRVLMVLPLAAAVPLMTFLMLTPWLEVWPSRWLSSERRVFVAGTIAGIPIVYYVVWMGASLVRGRWRVALALVGLSVVTTLAVAGGWLWLDRKSMAAIEHYRWEGWELVLLAGAYVAAALWFVGRRVSGVFRLVRRRAVGA